LGQHHIARQDRHQPREVAQRQSLQLQIIRTRRIPFVQSRAAWPLFAMTLVVMAVGIALPFSATGSSSAAEPAAADSPPAARTAARSPPPSPPGSLAGYMVLTQTVKGFYSRRYGWQ
jgi:Mg2+-importing ATPase